MSLTLNKSAYTKLIEEDIEWLLKQPRTLEREHIVAVLKESVESFYPLKSTFHQGLGAIVPDKMIKVLTGLVDGNWCIYYCDPEETKAANQLVNMGLVIRETNEPKESGDAPIGAWKLKPGVKQLILTLGAESLMSKLGDAVLKQLKNAPST